MSHILKFVIALAGCSIAAALAIGVPMCAGATQAALPASEARSLLDQHVVLVRGQRHELRTQRPVGPITALIGEGWG
jgi:hypothetical protein